MKTIFAALIAGAVGAGLSAVSAATLSGDTVTKTVFNNGSSIPAFNETFAVGPGVDNLDGNIGYDLNGAADGDRFVFHINPLTFAGVYLPSGLSEVIFSDLDFSGGEILTGFNVIDNGPLNAGYEVLSGSSFRIFWQEDDFTLATGERFFVADYLTEGSDAAVPLPAGGLLMVSGLAALGLARRRRRA